MRRASRWTLLLLVVALLGAALWAVSAAGGARRLLLGLEARTWSIPVVDTAGMSPPVAASIERARRAVRASPAAHASWYEYGTTLQAHALTEAAAIVLRRAAELRPDDPRPPYLLAIMGPSLGMDLEATLALFEQVRKLDPRYPPLFLRQGNALAEAGRVEDARSAYTRAVELDPSYPMAHRQLGLAALDSGDLAGALLHLEFAAELVEDDYLTWVGLARAYRRKGWEDKARMAGEIAASTLEVMSFRDSVYEDMFARNVGPLRQLELAGRYAEAGDHAAAVEALLLGAEGMGESSDLHRRLATSYRALGQAELADAHEQRAREPAGKP